MKLERFEQVIIGSIAVVCVLLLVSAIAGSGRRGCGCISPEPIVTGIDAGPGEDEIGARLDAALVEGAIRIEAIEDKFEEDMEAFDARQREEYERLRGGDDLEAAARYLSEWSRRRATP
jgi:hypothetical protein